MSNVSVMLGQRVIGSHSGGDERTQATLAELAPRRSGTVVHVRDDV